MEANINKVTLCGRVVRAPGQSTTAKVTGLRVATTDAWHNKSGEPHKRTDTHAVAIITPHLADWVMQHVQVGDLVYVEGTLQTRKFSTEAADRVVVEVVVLPSTGVFKVVRAAEPVPQMEAACA